MGAAPSSPRADRTVDAYETKRPPESACRGFKVALIGEPCTGKTSVFLRYVKNQFNYLYKATKKADVGNVVKKVNLPNNTVASMSLWDLPGLEDMDLRDSYYRNVDAAIVVVDMTDPTSIELAAAWKLEFMNRVSKVQLMTRKNSGGVDVPSYEKRAMQPKEIPVLLLGNKYDLIEEKIQADHMEMALNVPADEEILNIEKQSDTSEAKEKVDEPAALSEEGTLSDEEDEEEGVIGVQRGPKKDEEKPECVLLLEKVEREHGFIGSVMVSCKDNDNSVYGAIQSLMRYLMWKASPKQPKPKMEISGKKERKVMIQRYFHDTGIEEINSTLNRCHSIVQRIEKYSEIHEESLHNFKQICSNLGLISTSECSLEEAVIGLRDTTQELGLDLKAKHYLLYAYFWKIYVPICTAILRDSTPIANFLIQMDKKIAEEAKPLIIKAKHRNQAEKTLDILDNNRGKILFYQSQNEDLSNQVKSAENKIRISLIW
ncbi:hypothetical protein CAPTEDRAFT_208667 [Capitella teleta]|uniref:Uncharacterized protein n=1 Tax=Capitella teleta TaxID=283909 RepID=R7TNG4_CAPTE|nr:hypothetical protein CAPTEDRAFT_208667 [Capitella teleta]|eukprot:ELT95393.1 hypothetical protein CAPTEDRAFT_208667 [Capitella teleta]